DHTERMLSEQGAHLTRQRLADGSTRVEIEPADELASVDRSIPGDPSSAAFLLLAAVLVEGSQITVSGVNLNPERTGFFRLLAKMGADISGYEAPPETLEQISKEPVGDVSARSSSLVGITVGAEEIPAAVDEITLLALAGCFASGTTRVSGAGELKVKETDRIAGVVELISAIGGTIEATDDGFVVTGSGDLRGGTIDSLGDHRLAMLGAVAGLASEQGVTVTNFEAADVSYPGFVDDISRLA
ncbi:MAG: 3-phosphoshikimate 1-carboxyvinyltransferase, partial [Solirubrobacterales bacterium]|nr:3-phosphoshikimate 1-carboxyvinyltransferase [Solirubrobacterales bacterium]